MRHSKKIDNLIHFIQRDYKLNLGKKQNQKQETLNWNPCFLDSFGCEQLISH